MKPVFLLGMPASGKTTLGRAAAREAGLMFIDLDAFIEQRYHTTVAAIFASEGGEARFRDLERRMLQEVAQYEDVLVAVGGGTPCHHDNMDTMLASGLTVWLQASPAILKRRLLVAPAGKRPLAAVDDIDAYIYNTLESRSPHYGRAALTFDSGRLDNARDIAATVPQFISLINDHLPK